MDPRSRPPLHRLPDHEVERLLAAGERRTELVAAFGRRGYSELSVLARQAAQSRRRGGPVVYVLPGLMGSRLGIRGRLVDDVVWLDPFEVAAGHLTRLALPRGAPLVALGTMLMSSLKLKLSLEIAGFDARLHAYDWRLDVATLAAGLLGRVEREGVGDAMLVGHSLGGVVARRALADGGARIARVVQLGSPNRGSYAAVLALRGVYPTVRKLAALDLRHDAEDLARLVFRTLPSLCELLPARLRATDPDFLDPATWPDDALRPDARLLAAASAATGAADADPRCLGIVGLGQRTVVGAERDGGGFRFRTALDGDGTVPRALAEIEGGPTWYVSETHGGLPNNGRVIAAVGELLRTGSTRRLPSAARLRRDTRARWIDEATLRRVASRKLRWTDLSPDARRRLLEPVVSPEFHGRVPLRAIAAPPASRRAPESARAPRRLELRLVHGSIADANARALVLGVFQDVDPSGAARVLDARLDGAVRDFTMRRMISGRLGETFVLPCAPDRLIADFVVFAGLGPCAGFDAVAHGLAAGNAVRTLARAGVADFATVPFGAGSGLPAVDALTRQLAGTIAALHDADPAGTIRRVTVCEIDRARWNALRRALPRIVGRLGGDDIGIAFDDSARDGGRGAAPGPTPASPPSARRAASDDPAWLFVSLQAAGRGHWDCSSSLLTAGAKAAVLSGTARITDKSLRELLGRAGPGRLDARGIARYGRDLGRLLLAPPVLGGLGHSLRRPLVVVHDRESSRVPWEALCVGDVHPALAAGLSRRYRSDGLSVARWREDRAVGRQPLVLMVANPTGDLPGADDEGRALRDELTRHGLGVRSLLRDQATRGAVLAAAAADDCDVLHYAGHGYFEEDDPAAGGLVCAGGDVLRGSDLAGLDSLPSLVFFNACEAARVRKPAAGARGRLRGLRRSGSVAEAMLDGGVANFLGTHWSVGDAAALEFATTLYARLAGGEPLGAAVLEARRRVRALGSIDWADYVHYGNPQFVLAPDFANRLTLPPADGGIPRRLT